MCDTDLHVRVQRSSSVMMRGTELKMAGERFAKNLGLSEFKGSDRWLSRFKCHGLTTRKVYGESLDADEGVIDQSRQELTTFIQEEALQMEKFYNADETGLYYRLVPEATLAIEEEKKYRAAKCVSL